MNIPFSIQQGIFSNQVHTKTTDYKKKSTPFPAMAINLYISTENKRNAGLPKVLQVCIQITPRAASALNPSSGFILAVNSYAYLNFSR